MEQQRRDLALDSGSIPKLLLKYATPSIISMTASSIYNIVDSMFVGQGVGPLAISGFSLTLPVMNLAAAFGSLIGVGASSLVAVSLGKRDYKTATNALGNAVSLNFIIGILFTILGLIFLDPILYFFGASHNTISYAREYMQIILMGNTITHLYFGLNDNLRASGYPQKAMIATLTAVFLNCILDPLFIFGFGWGIRGAAIATVLSQIVAFIILVRHYLNPNSTIHFEKGIFQPKKSIIAGIFSVGLSPFLLNTCNCIIVIIINKSFFKYGGDLAIGAFGIANRMVFLFVMLVMGLTQGMQPLVGFNYGAKKYDRVIKLVKLTALLAMGVTTLCFIVNEFFTPLVVSIFTTDEALKQLAINGLRINVLAFPIVGLSIVISNFFQAIRKPGKAIFTSLTRQVIFLIPLLLILPRFYGINGVWATLPMSDVISTIVASILLIGEIKNFRQEMAKGVS